MVNFLLDFMIFDLELFRQCVVFFFIVLTILLITFKYSNIKVIAEDSICK